MGPFYSFQGFVSITIITYLCLPFASVVEIVILRYARHMPRTSPYTVRLSSAEKSYLETMARKYTAPYRSVIRAKIVLLAAQGRPNDQIAASLSLPRQIVSKWRKRFCQERLAGLEDEPRTGRPVDSPSSPS
jgi:hypothetical protein